MRIFARGANAARARGFPSLVDRSQTTKGTVESLLHVPPFFQSVITKRVERREYYRLGETMSPARDEKHDEVIFVQGELDFAEKTTIEEPQKPVVRELVVPTCDQEVDLATRFPIIRGVGRKFR